MKTVPVPSQTIDMETGAVVKEEIVDFSILPPASTACQVCGHDPAHAPGDPHNAQSLYYQYAFYGEHGRWPTWKDAIAHCDAETQTKWETALKDIGYWTE